MPPVSLEMSTPRGVEMPFSSPQFSTISSISKGDTFRSPRPTKASNIRVVTRIRPLLEGEIARGRKVCITPIQSTTQPQDNLSPESHGDDENTISPRNILLTKFRPSNNSPSSHDDNFLPQASSIATPSSLPPPSKNAAAARSPSSISTSLIASSLNSNKQFDFDAVLGMDSTQQQVYETSVGDNITNNIFRGINFTIMAYGQTSSGKSHTMQGFNDGPSAPQHNNNDTENRCPNSPPDVRLSENDGIIPRALHDLFKRKMDFKSSGKGSVSMELTYVELYNEEMRDLLDNDDNFRPLKMLDQGDNGGVVIEGLTTIPIQSANQVHGLLNYAADRRATSSTNANIQSSRSHAICTLTVSVTPTDKLSKTESTQAKLTLVDLAGSERIKKTGVVGLQQQESITINQDLFALGQVVSALADKSRSTGKGKQAHVPFRNSKLTRLLRESLGGNCFTVLISCVSPADLDMEESINTLRYAEKARSISNSIKRNVNQAVLTPAQCAALTAENMHLKAQVVKLKNRVAAEISRDTAGSLLDHEEAEECSPTSSPRDIFRHDSRSTEEVSRSSTPTEMLLSQVSSDEMSHYSHHEEKKHGIPIWKHFQDLAKITQNVTISKESQCEPTREIELKESKQVQRRDHNYNASTERCLSYEMSLYPTGTDDLADEVEENSGGQAIVNQNKEIVRLQEESKKLREGMDSLKSKHTELEDAIQSKQDELHVLSNELSSKTASLEEKHQEVQSLLAMIDTKKTELSALDELKEKSEIELNCDRARSEELREEAEHLKKVTEQMANEINMLDISSPQRSFAGILNRADRGFFREAEDGELELDVEDCFGVLQSSVSNLQSQLHRQEAARTETDLRKHTAVLEQERCLAKKKIGELEREIADLQKGQQTLIETKTQEKLESDKQVADYEETIKLLRVEASKLEEEKDRSRSLEERINFMFHDYESMATLMQQKISDLQDECSSKNDFEHQFQVLRKASADLESTIQEKEMALKKECSEKNDLKLLVRTLEEKIQDLVGLLRAEKEKAEDKGLVVDTSATQKSKTLNILSEIATPQSANSGNGSDTSPSTQDKTESPQSAESNLSQQPDYIRMKATKMLQLADQAIEKAATDGKSITSTSCCSSAGTEFRPSQHQSDTVAPSPLQNGDLTKEDATSCMPILTSSTEKTDTVQITNLAVVADQNVCSCSSNRFAENAEYVEFYLPHISVDCTCGKRSPKAAEEADENVDPCALTAILRPWQVQFLADVGIGDATSLVFACNHRGAVLATQLRKWRRAKGLPSVRTKSCGVALHIWSRTCKSVLRAVRSQKAQGLEPKRPDFLELNIGENHTAVSSLGSGPFRT